MMLNRILMFGSPHVSRAPLHSNPPWISIQSTSRKQGRRVHEGADPICATVWSLRVLKLIVVVTENDGSDSLQGVSIGASA